jgi:outer membrane immunogenic protein
LNAIAGRLRANLLRTSLLGLISALLIAGTARAADMVPRYPAAPVPYYAFTWAGPYAGATLGYQWGSIDNNPTRPAGVAGGLEAGFNWQTGNFVYGGEADINLSAAADTFAPWKFSNPWFGTVRVRAGIAIDNVLIFGSAGLAYGELTGSASGGPSESHTSLGWTAGLGAEMSFTRHWSAKAEWLYLNLDDRQFAVTAANNGLAANLVRLGLNYRF